MLCVGGMLCFCFVFHLSEGFVPAKRCFVVVVCFEQKCSPKNVAVFKVGRSKGLGKNQKI